MELGGLSGAGRVISKLVTFADAVLAVAAFFCSGQLINFLESSGNKNNLRTI